MTETPDPQKPSDQSDAQPAAPENDTSTGGSGVTQEYLLITANRRLCPKCDAYNPIQLNECGNCGEILISRKDKVIKKEDGSFNLVTKIEESPRWLLFNMAWLALLVLFMGAITGDMIATLGAAGLAKTTTGQGMLAFWVLGATYFLAGFRRTMGHKAKCVLLLATAALWLGIANTPHLSQVNPGGLSLRGLAATQCMTLFYCLLLPACIASAWQEAGLNEIFSRILAVMGSLAALQVIAGVLMRTSNIPGIQGTNYLGAFLRDFSMDHMSHPLVMAGNIFFPLVILDAGLSFAFQADEKEWRFIEPSLVNALVAVAGFGLSQFLLKANGLPSVMVWL